MDFEYIDVHTHANFAAFDKDRDEVIKRAINSGVAIVNVGTQKKTSLEAVEMAEKYKSGVYAIVGVHPIHTSKSFHDLQELGEGGREFTSRGEDFDYEYYKKLAMNKKVVGIGECGLDYYRIEKDFEDKQQEAFCKQIALANEVNKPLMLHVRNGSNRSAYKDALAILKRDAKVRGDFHFFAGGWEEAREILDAGFFLSFTGVITFTHDYDEVVYNTPLDRILSETDAPYVAPEPYRGRRNEPSFVIEAVKAVARIKKMDLDLVRKQLFMNAEAFFGVRIAE